ncbi:MAG: NAD(P)-dependent oxidoreductase [Verrucomicrobiota bacterium]
MQDGELEKVGVIGLGIIGSRVATRLRDSGRHVYVWNRSPKTEPNFLGSPEEIAQLSEVIQIFVTDGNGLVEVAESLARKTTQRHTIISNCTADPESVVKAYQIIKETGAAFLDAPFTGSKLASEKGALVYYVGGDSEALARARPVLEVSAKEILVLGRVGEATVLKIATNMITASTVEALSEAYGLVTSAGISAEQLKEAIEHNACSSVLTGMKLPTIMQGDYEPHFSLSNMFKDAQYALSLAKNLGVELPVTTTTANLMFKAMKKGQSDFDFSVLAARYQEAAHKSSSS